MKQLRALRYFFKTALRSLVYDWKINVFTTFSVSIIGFLFLTMFLSLKQVQSIFYRFGEQANIIVFLNTTNSDGTKDKILNEVCKTYGIQACVYRSVEDARKLFVQDYPELKSVVKQLQEQPFLASVQIFFDAAEDQIETIDRITEQTRKLSGVASVDDIQAPLFAWSKYFSLFQGVVLLIGLLVGLATLFLLFSSMSMSVQRHRNEIEILQLVGARGVFIALPFVVQGLIQTLFGLTLTVLVMGLTISKIQELTAVEFNQLFFSGLQSLSFGEVIVFLLMASVLGGFGSLLAVRSYLNKLW